MRAGPQTQHMWKRVSNKGKGGGGTDEGDNSWKKRGEGEQEAGKSR